MKTNNTIGLLSGIVLLLGGIFKVMHYPGASMLIPIGILLLAIYLTLVFLSRLKSGITGVSKILYGMIYILLLVTAIAILFNIMHYPGARYFRLPVVLVFTSLLIPVISIIIYKRETAEQSYMMVFIVTYFSLMAVLMIKNGLPNHILNGFSYSDDMAISDAANMARSNEATYKMLAADPKLQELQKMVNEITTNIDEMKLMMFNAANTDNSTQPSLNDKIFRMDYRADYDTPGALFVGGEDGEAPKTGKLSASGLKTQIETLRAWIMKEYGADQTISKNLGLATEGDVEHDEMKMTWEQCNFEHKPVVSIATFLDHLKCSIRIAEAQVLSHVALHTASQPVAAN